MNAKPTDPSPTAPRGKATAGGQSALLDQAKRRLLGNYRPAPVVMVEGRGCEVFDTEGHRYLDFCAGVATVSLGHGHPELTRAIADQAGQLMHVSNYVYNLENIELADELCVATGFDRAFFCNSGAEANEGLFKLARRHFHERRDPRRQRVIAFERAFHGRTMGALSLTGNPLHREGFGPLLTGIEHLRYGDLGAVEQVMGPDVAAVLVEPVQGEGGVFPAPEGFLPGLRAACD
ncbi:MAG: aminotransferase class III-fold pyridoxal phosphate-dependent enzyme, partial [Deltaproteobacteria bacterium]|nr:aminotransferase class III-fold pyridoxal phosphate-dependent enzyme [Deltaproteobacteria bacterium]